MSIQSKESLRVKVEELTKVATIPTILTRIIELTESRDSSIKDLEKVIEHDQAIASRVVGISNAVYYGFPRKITSISQAILILGLDMVKGLAISTIVLKAACTLEKAIINSMWSHSFETAMTSVLVAERSGLVNKDSAFLAGLLHDIGRPIMCQLFGREYTDISDEDSNRLVKIENYLFGGGHDEVGAWFAEKCGLPPECVAAILYHHNPENCVAKGGAAMPPLVPIIYLSNLITVDGKENNGRYTSISGVQAEAIKALNLDRDSLDEIRHTVDGFKEHVSDYYS